MLYRNIFLLALITLSSFSAVFADDANKVIIPKIVTCADQELQLNGFGIRKKLFIKLYTASLYVQEKTTDANQFLKMSQASCIRLHITSSKITSKKMIKATREGFESSTKGNTAPIEAEIETFLSWFKQPIKKENVFEFAFIPHNVVHVSKNGTELGIIESKTFASALFGIWLGDMPVQQNLKSELLGQ